MNQGDLNSPHVILNYSDVPLDNISVIQFRSGRTGAQLISLDKNKESRLKVEFKGIFRLACSLKTSRCFHQSWLDFCLMNFKEMK